MYGVVLVAVTKVLIPLIRTTAPKPLEVVAAAAVKYVSNVADTETITVGAGVALGHRVEVHPALGRIVQRLAEMVVNSLTTTRIMALLPARQRHMQLETVFFNESLSTSWQVPALIRRRLLTGGPVRRWRYWRRI